MVLVRQARQQRSGRRLARTVCVALAAAAPLGLGAIDTTSAGAAGLLSGNPMPGPTDPLPTVGGFSLGACTGDPAHATRMSISIGGTPTYAMVSLPSSAPRGIVIWGHGYSEWASRSSTTSQIESFAKMGAVAVAPDFRGTTDPANPTNENQNSRGFPMAAGAQDVAALALATLAQCPVSIVIAAGGSTGGGIAALATTFRQQRPSGGPIFDYWIGLSPLTDVAPDWAGATALGKVFPTLTGSHYYADTATDMELQTGGTPATVPAAYLARSVITRAGDMAAAHLRGAIILHSAADLDVTAEQPTVMTAVLQANGIPTTLVVDTTPSPGEQDASLDGFFIGGPLSAFHIPYQQHLAGHQGPHLRQDATNAVGWLIAGGGITGLHAGVQMGTGTALAAGANTTSR